MTRRISLDKYLIQERTSGVSVIDKTTEKEWRFPVDAADERDIDIMRRKDSVDNVQLNEHSNETDEVHGIAKGDAVAGIADIMLEIQNHSNKSDGVHGVPSGDSIATESSLDGKADLPHGDEAHSVSYAKRQDILDHNNKTGGVHGIAGSDRIAAVRQVNQRAPRPHGNDDHDPKFATRAELDEKANETHGNENHTEQYITGVMAIDDPTSLGTVDTLNFRENFALQIDGNTLTIDSQGGVSSGEFNTHTNDSGAHHTRYTDQEALAAVSDVTGDLVGIDGGRITGPIVQEHESDIESHGWTHLGNVPRSDSTAYLLIAPESPGVRMVGTLVGIRGSSSNRSYANISISFGSNTNDSPIANGTVTRLEAWSQQSPALDFKMATYNGTQYYALELETSSNYTNYNAGLYFSGILQNTDIHVVDVGDVTSVQQTSIMNDAFEVGDETVYHTGNANPADKNHDHSGETINPRQVNADAIQLPTYPSGQGEGSIWLVE